MKTVEEKINIQENSFFFEEYKKITNTFSETVLVKMEWNKMGDYFQKFSTYDNSYTPIHSLGNTTLI